MVEGHTKPRSSEFAIPTIREVSVDTSGSWLAKGWADILRSPGISLGYGAAFVAFSYLLALGMIQAGLGSMVLPLVGAFLLVGPLLAVGLYEISRRHERGEKVDLSAIFAARRNIGQISLMGIALLLIAIAWIRIALLLFMLFYSSQPPSLENFLRDVLFSLDSVPFLLLGSAVGGALAALTFAISAVSLPMLLDRDVSAMTAVATSVAAVRKNWQVMVGWAAMIVLIVGVGIATFFIGLAIALPLIGHASWHAYRAIVAD